MSRLPLWWHDTKAWLQVVCLPITLPIAVIRFGLCWFLNLQTLLIGSLVAFFFLLPFANDLASLWPQIHQTIRTTLNP